MAGRNLASWLQRAGAGVGCDAIFVHQGKSYNLEIKDLFADYGEKC